MFIFDGKDHKVANGWPVNNYLFYWQGGWGSEELKESLKQIIQL